MFLKHDSYDGFPTRKDLMSLSTIKNEISPTKDVPKHQYRALKTDDIPGAKVRAPNRSPQPDPVYSGLNLPSYSRNFPAQSPDFSRNLANFYGSTPAGPRPQADQFIASSNLPIKAIANFYGVTPPASRAIPQRTDEIEEQYRPVPLPESEIAKLYGGTPPQSGKFASPAKIAVSAQNLAGFYGATPQMSRGFERKKQTGDISPTVVAQFYGITPPASREYARKLQEMEISPGNVAGFYGATPPGSNKNQLGIQLAGKNIMNPYVAAGVSPLRDAKLEVSAKNTANFYGSTPPPSRPSPFKSSGPVISSKNLANFFGSTPPPSRGPASFSPNPSNSPPGLPAKAVANFYGVTPLQSRSTNIFIDRGFNRNTQDTLPARAVANFYGVTPQNSKYAEIFKSSDTELPIKVVANFYGVTPPESAGNNFKKIPQINDSLPVPDKALANFYGVTPPATGKGRETENFIEKKAVPSDFSRNVNQFFGVAKEFEHAEKLAGAPQKSYEANSAKFYGVTPPPSGANIFASKSIRLFT